MLVNMCTRRWFFLRAALGARVRASIRPASSQTKGVVLITGFGFAPSPFSISPRSPGCLGHIPEGIPYVGQWTSSAGSASSMDDVPLIEATSHGHLECVKYIVEELNVDMEELGSACISGLYAHGVPALWCAATLGHLQIVAYLLSRGANANVSTTSSMTPLRAACYQGFIDIARILVEHGAGPQIGLASTPVLSKIKFTYLIHLPDARLRQWPSRLVKYLVDVGANVNKKKTDGKSALHACAESGHLEVVKVLMNSNARVEVDRSGITPLIAASVLGDEKIVTYLTKIRDIPIRERIDALELLGATFVDEKNDMASAVRCWKLAMSRRYVDGSLTYPKATEDPGTCENIKEITTLEQLEGIESNPDEIRVQALLVRERVVGLSHFRTLRHIRSRGFYYANKGDFKRCFGLWMHAVDVRQKNQEPLDHSRMLLLNSFTDVFTALIHRRQAHCRNCTPVKYFGDLVNLLQRLTKEIDFISCKMKPGDKFGRGKLSNDLHFLFVMSMHYVSLLTKLRPDLSEAQWDAVKRAVHQIVKRDPRGLSGWTLLHIACRGGFANRARSLPVIAFPSLEIVHLLLEVGADPLATDQMRNTPLHALADNTENLSEILDALLEAGAHLDATNQLEQTFGSLMTARGQDISSMVNVARHTSLQCLAAAAVRKHDIPYKTILQPRLSQFVDIH
ncbi:protein fem-1 homolog C-like [Macrobrachium nipponense]|uniref:protein fem-1 homolog C-like n=1 Tax=Macrobrachium nipponense TaxID=159736 RepID=UPI0030C87EC8